MNSPTTMCRPAGGGRCCASTSRPCGRYGPRRRRPRRRVRQVRTELGLAQTGAVTDPGSSRRRRHREELQEWIARSADGWITTPRRRHRHAGATAAGHLGRRRAVGVPRIVALDFKPVADKLERWRRLGVTEVLFGLPDRPADDVARYVERLAAKLAEWASRATQPAEQTQRPRHAGISGPFASARPTSHARDIRGP